MSTSDEEIKKILMEIQSRATATIKTLEEMAEIIQNLGSTGNIHGPMPPKFEPLIGQLDSGTKEIDRLYVKLGDAFSRLPGPVR